MATNRLAQPALYVDGICAVSQSPDLFTVDYEGLSLKLTPLAMMALILRSRRAMDDWNAFNNARAAGFLVDDTAEIIAFPKACPIVHCNGEAC